MGLGGVVVVGGASMDLDVQASHFPQTGETVLGQNLTTRPGGKGVAQAIAIGRLGGKPRLIAKIGNDPFGHEIRRAAQTGGVDTGWVIVDPQHATGLALRTVTPNGGVATVTVPGANLWLHPDDVRDVLTEENPAVLLVSLEVPSETATAAIAAAPNDCLVVLNLAPMVDIPDEVLSRVDYLIVNAPEAERLTGILPADDPECLAASETLIARGARNVVITLGEDGAFLTTPQSGRHFSTLQHRIEDKSHLDDVFVGVFARFLAEGHPIDRCVYLANAAAALAEERPPTLRQMRDAVPELF
jgi:ribokinase